MSLHNNRYKAIDGLRGIAALGVVLYHLSLNLKAELSQILPEFLNLIFSFGFLGVPIFFVISGFVISLSIGQNKITKKYAANFILRRSIRLDPTYWAAIFFGLFLLFIKNHISSDIEAFPSLGNVLAHMFYLQDILVVKPLISVVFWTLCLEVQFYLFYLLSLWFSQKVCLGRDRYFIHTIIMLCIGVYSILLDREFVSIAIPGLFLSNWHYFLMGALVGNVVRKMPYAQMILLVWIFIEIVSCGYFNIKAYQIAGMFSSVLIYILWSKDLMGSVFTSRGLQYLGKISYTLYLFHPDVGWKVISFGKTFLHNQLSPFSTLMLFGLGIAASICCAHFFHVICERPSLWLTNELKGKNFKHVFKIFSKSNN